MGSKHHLALQPAPAGWSPSQRCPRLQVCHNSPPCVQVDRHRRHASCAVGIMNGWWSPLSAPETRSQHCAHITQAAPHCLAQLPGSLSRDHAVNPNALGNASDWPCWLPREARNHLCQHPPTSQHTPQDRPTGRRKPSPWGPHAAARRETPGNLA